MSLALKLCYFWNFLFILPVRGDTSLVINPLKYKASWTFGSLILKGY
jgi:hypothetical protein